MEVRDTVRLQKQLALVGEMCGRKLPPAALSHTAEELAGYPEAAVQSAMRHVTREAGAWRYGDSLLAALLSHIHGTRDEAAVMAWAAVMRSLEHRDTEVVYSDQAVEAAVRLCGGRAWLCNMDSHTLAQVRRDFMVYYRECAMTEKQAEAVAVPESAVVIETGTKSGRILRGWPVCLMLPANSEAPLQLGDFTASRPSVAPADVWPPPEPDGILPAHDLVARLDERFGETQPKPIDVSPEEKRQQGKGESS